MPCRKITYDVPRITTAGGECESIVWRGLYVGQCERIGIMSPEYLRVCSSC